ncbi:flagellar hook-basal body complex protein FliE [Rhodovulum marinum]|uniref:Flagellar hook-basal body complex protein FliE n=1 Tax=Rhodovulum marinum TaxID=320662 RepID=A0A4R2PTA1_9RHOB|nr:flagellar hook-basal body complex protein FliE [Rhodovulum marinum]TCP39109.1 flagellar hook-basal body complex protein FliE [Rhodovulum marinum]
MDIRSSIAAQAYATAKPATQPQKPDTQGTGAFADAAQKFAQTLQSGEQTAMAAMSGSADPHALVQALAQTELAIETAVTVRDKVVEAYQEILRMPV